MNTTELQLELHQIIDQVKDNRILQAVHTILSSQVGIFAHSSKGEPISKSEFDEMIEVSEDDIKAGRLVSQKDLTEKIKAWKGR